jgi:hypothetical protein
VVINVIIKFKKIAAVSEFRKNRIGCGCGCGVRVDVDVDVGFICEFGCGVRVRLWGAFGSGIGFYVRV